MNDPNISIVNFFPHARMAFLVYEVRMRIWNKDIIKKKRTGTKPY